MAPSLKAQRLGRKVRQKDRYVPPLPSHLHFLQQEAWGRVTGPIPTVQPRVPAPVLFFPSPMGPGRISLG